MEWIKSWISGDKSESNAPKEQEITKNPEEGEEGEEDSCDACSSPCNIHAQYPPFLAARIDKKKQLCGTVKKPSQFHLLFFSGPKGPSTWPTKIDKDCVLPSFINSKVKERGLKVLLTACDATAADFVDTGSSQDEGSENTEKQTNALKLTECDVLLLPSRELYFGVNVENAAALIEDCLVKGGECEKIPHKKISDQTKLILVCSHKKRDKRCGTCGPLLADEFNSVIKSKELTETTKVLKVSHIGGHKFAATCIIYPQGDYYGRLTPCDAQKIIEEHIIKNKPVKEFWRGRIDLTPDQQIALCQSW